MKSNDREEYFKKLGLQREGALPPEARENSDRRQEDKGPPPEGDRRRGDRRKTRSAIGRERYLDMVVKERALFAQQGFTRSAEQLLSASGAGSGNRQLARQERSRCQHYPL